MSETDAVPCRRAAILGGGVIGAGWLARLVENGVDVALHDPAPNRARIEAVLAAADRAYASLTLAPRRRRGQWFLARSVADAVRDAELVIEAVPERLDLKRKVYAEAEDAAPGTALIASSTSGLKPTELQAGMRRPQRLLVAHPFQPVYLLPLVELVAGRQTDESAVERAAAIVSAIGMHPLRVRREIDAFIADRLLEAVWRESLWLVKDGIATTADIDDAIRYGFGLRWAQMGLFQTYRLGGGAGGMRHFLEQFAPTLSWPWTKLTDVPELDAALIDTIADQSEAQSEGLSLAELERARDDNLIAILRALRANDWGAGRTLADWERALEREAAARGADDDRPLRTLALTVPAHWTGPDGRMTEARCLDCFARASRALTAMLATEEAGRPCYAIAETHLRHLGPARAGEALTVTTQVLEGSDGDRLRLFHRLGPADGPPLATGEHLLLHADPEHGRPSAPAGSVRARVEALAASHAALPLPDGAGQAIGPGR